MTVSVGDICDGIETTLSTVAGMQSSTTYSEITEGLATFDCPRIEVYPQAGNCDPSGNVERTAVNAGVQQHILTVHVDLYARQRSELGEDMQAYVALVDELIDVLQTQEKPPFFGVEGIKAFSWRWTRAVLIKAQARYVGARFVVVCRIF